MLSLLERATPRERAIIVIALLVVLVLGVHAFVIEPYQERAAALREAIEQQRVDLVWMRSAIASLPATEMADSTSEFSGTLANFIDQAVRRQGLAGQLSQMSPIGADEIRIRYNAVDFNRLVNFIAQVNASGLEVKDLRISAADNPGIVDSSLVLVRR
ncbi:MAG: type II secretion system protein M [Gammaproteobacteria bacterium]|nr:type II secretion system protein M [Gammaproteobacteria bacterium]MDH3537553.1 type II secretion system protein M [Gammaproteobacteria bacterium]